MIGLIALVGCDEPGPTRPITEVRTFQPDPPREIQEVDTATRFGFRPMGTPAAAPSVPRFEFETPAGWKELPPAMMKDVNLLVAGQPGAECYLTVLSGGGGRVEENIARWCGQLGIPALEPAAVAALPRVPFLGGEAVEFEAEGTFRGQPGTTMVAVLLEQGPNAYSLKMVGPTELLEREREAFDTLRASMALTGGADRSASDPHGAGPSAAAAPAPGEAPTSGKGLRWEVPEGWTGGRSTSSMRAGTLHPGGNPAVECVIFVFAGSGGTELMNVQRWYGQMGRTPPPTLDDLPEIEMLGVTAHLVDLAGTYTNTGMGDDTESGAGMLAVFCELSDRGVAVKMAGPQAEVAAAREGFLALCASMRRDG